MDNPRRRIGMHSLVAVLITALPLLAQEPPRDAQPQLRLETGGPTSYVTALAFDPDGETLYAAGYDKVVMVWRLDRPSGKFVLDEAATFRIPIGPGLRGAINAVAVSPDGHWLAVGGQGVIRGGAGFRDPGLVLPTLGSMTEAMRLDEGTIFLFHTATREMHRLRQHMGPVLSLAFAPDAASKPVLVSAGQEWDEKSNKFIGTLRAWNVEEQRDSDFGGVILPEPTTRPGLAIERTGPAPTALRVGFAWQQGSLGVWNVARGAHVDHLPDGQSNHTVALLSQNNTFVTGSSRNGAGVLQRWNARPGQTPIKGQELLLGPRGALRFVPDAIAAVSSQPGGETDTIAAAVLLAEPHVIGGANKLVPTRFELQVISGDLRKTLSRTPLWESDVPPRMPVMASAPGGKFLAVAGGGDHEIHVFPIAGLLGGQAEKQTLRGLGASTGQASLVRQGDRWGLLLSETRKPAPGSAAAAPKSRDAVFDFANKKFETLAAEHAWQPATAAAVGWQLTHLAPPATTGANRNDGRAAIIVRGPNKGERRVELLRRHGVTDFALLSPAAGRTAPLLAVALHDRGQPKLVLYHAGTGEQIRQFTGHTQRIRSVGFAEDGRLLVSAGDDQTICVWSLTDLDQTLAAHGLLPGVAVKEEGGAVVVAQLSDDSPARASLKSGDRLLGRVVGGKLSPWTRAREFYDAMWRARPGTTITVRRQRGAAANDVALRVAQGIDERKPLFSFFVTRGDNLAERQWIGWSPIGPYDASDRRIEKHLGWHFHAGRHDRLDFARADLFRDRYHRPGLLAELVNTADLPDAPPVVALPRPEIKLTLRERASEEFASLAVVRHPQVALDIGIDPRFPREKFAQLEVLYDGESIAKVEPSADSWLHDLSQVPWKRGEHKLSVVLKTSEQPPQEFRDELTFHYLPLPPSAKVTAPAVRSQVVEGKQLRIRATVAPAVAGEAMQVELIRSGDKPVVIRNWNSADPIEIDELLNLEPGHNVIDVVARNRDAAERTAVEETVTERFVITLDLGAVAPPQIVLERLEPAAAGADKEQGVRIVPGNRAMVLAGEVRLIGSISAGQTLARAEWRMNDQTQPLAGFNPNAAKSFAIRQPITLEPGVQKIRIESQAAGGKPAHAEVEIDYRPALPEVAIIGPASGEVFSGHEAVRPTTLLATLSLADEQRPFEAAVLFNDETLAAKVDMATKSITANLPLVPGENRIQLKLTNAWLAEHRTEPLVVVYRPTPKVIEVAAAAKVDRPFVTITGTLESVARPTIDIGGQPVVADDIRFDEATKQWRFEARDVPLPSDSKQIVVRAGSKYGAAIETTVIDAPEIMAPPPPLANVEILDPRTDSTTTTEQATIRFAVRSASPLKEIELLHDGRPVHRSAVAAQLKPNADGSYETSDLTAIELHAGQNDLAVRAINDGGRQTATVSISYEPLPVRLVIDGFSPVDQPQQITTAIPAKAGRIRFAGPAPQGRVLLRGRVVWADANDKRLSEKQQVQVWVNGFQQLPTGLKPCAAGALERPFSTTVVLNRSEDNLIEVGLPKLVHEASSRLACLADCEKPIREQRLHLLIVGIGVAEQSKAELRQQALAALEVRTTASAEASQPLHVRRKIYGPLIGPHVTRGKVVTQLCNIKSSIENLAKVAPSSDVVVIYYQGGELIFADGRFFLTTRQALRGEASPTEREASRLKLYALDSDLLTQFVADTRGAHVLLLDVARMPEQQLAANLWPSESRLAMLRYAWLSRDERPTAPGDATLIADLKRVLPKSALLKQLEEELGKNFTLTGSGRVSKQYQDALRFESYVPESLNRLELGTP